MTTGSISAARSHNLVGPVPPRRTHLLRATVRLCCAALPVAAPTAPDSYEFLTAWLNLPRPAARL